MENLKNELVKGKELAKQLQVHVSVRGSSSSSMDEGGALLVEKILCSYDNALSLLCSNVGIQRSESHYSLNGSPTSEDSDHDQTNSPASSKRNILPTWTHKFQVSPGIGLEGSLDDGFSWRKYGQKGILGAKHPRGYYRCTHRNLLGCIATKRIQRSDDDPTVFVITYRGKHTCNQVSNLGTPSATPEFQPQNLVQQTSLRVITENLAPTHEPTLFPPLTYDPTLNYEAVAHVGSMKFSPSPSFLPPTTSVSGFSYYSASSSRELSEGIVGNQNLQPTKSELCEIFSSPTSGVNSQTLGLEFPFGEFEMEPSFTFDNTNFFS